jgi:hypothetical protein
MTHTESSPKPTQLDRHGRQGPPTDPDALQTWENEGGARLQRATSDPRAGWLSTQPFATCTAAAPAACRSGERETCDMTRFLHWRKMTWTFAVWSALMAGWLVASAFVSSPAASGMMNASGAWIISLWLVGVGFLGILWFTTRPLGRQGHGARFRRLSSPLTLAEKRAARGAAANRA